MGCVYCGEDSPGHDFCSNLCAELLYSDRKETQMETPKSYKIAVHTVSCAPGAWTYNGMRYSTEEKAKEAGESLFMRWTAVDKWEVHPSNDEPNA